MEARVYLLVYFLVTVIASLIYELYRPSETIAITIAIAAIIFIHWVTDKALYGFKNRKISIKKESR